MAQTPMADGAKFISKKGRAGVRAYLCADGEETLLASCTTEEEEHFLWLIGSAAKFHKVPHEIRGGSE